MSTEVVMPQMGESIAEGTITKWLKQVGERVERDEPLFEISTDKVDAEIPSPAAGTLTEVRYKEGDTVEVNTVVPVIKRAYDLSISGLARAANDLADRARTKQLKPDEVTGGTFTITNPGVFGGLFGTPIINQPQLAILGVGKIEKRAKVLTSPDGEDYIAIRSLAYFALSFDHRIIDGADAERFLAYLKEHLENAQFAI